MTWLEAVVSIAVAFFGGAGITAYLSFKTEKWKFKAQRTAEKEDRAEEKADKTKRLSDEVLRLKEQDAEKNEEIDERLEHLEKQMAVQNEALKLMLLDRILHLGQSYIARGEITFEDRKRLHAMHSVYHDGLDGNGDAGLLMNDIDDLPLKK